MKLTRRALLSALPLAAQTGLHRIDSVRAWVMPLLGTGRFGTANFKGDHDPARQRWFGPFSQLAGSILVEIKTTGGLTGYGLGGGGSAAVNVIQNHLKDFLLKADPANIELLWEQMYQSSLFYGRKGLAIHAISGIDLALWDLAGKAAGKPVYQLLGGATKERVPVYLTGRNVRLGVEKGIRAFKLPIDSAPHEGRAGMARAVKEIESARAAIGPDAELMNRCPLPLERSVHVGDGRPPGAVPAHVHRGAAEPRRHGRLRPTLRTRAVHANRQRGA